MVEYSIFEKIMNFFGFAFRKLILSVSIFGFPLLVGIILNKNYFLFPFRFLCSSGNCVFTLLPSFKIFELSFENFFAIVYNYLILITGVAGLYIVCLWTFSCLVVWSYDRIKKYLEYI